MRSSTNPVVGAVLAVFLLLAGWYMTSNGTGNAALFGWAFIVVGLVAGVVNLALIAKRRR